MRFTGFIFAVFCIILIPVAVRAEADVSSRLAGRIVLEVERHGEAWYVSPTDGRRYFLGTPDDAWRILSEQGLGITNADLARIPLPDENRDKTLARRLAGRILLQVESRGEAWYVDPVDLRRYRLATPAETFRVLEGRGLGISETDIAAIPKPGDDGFSVLRDVPFVAQAPLGEWHDNRQHEACEEAAVIMALAWATNDDIDAREARDAFIAMSEWQRRAFGYYEDTSATDTLDRLVRTYSGFENAELRAGVTVEDLKRMLRDGRIVIAPVNGRAIGNPYFSPPGPLRHMIVVVGYDAAADEFVVHDPGTRRGEAMRYESARLMASIGDYASGRYAPIPAVRDKNVIVVRK